MADELGFGPKARFEALPDDLTVSDEIVDDGDTDLKYSESSLS